MSAIGDLFLRMLVDDKGFAVDLEKKAGKAGDKAGKTLGARMSNGVKQAVGGMKGGILGGLGLGAGLGAIGAVTLATDKLVDAIGHTIDAASDQREAMSLAGQVFEENTADIKKWSDQAATSFGESSTEALQFASNFGTAFKNVGFALDEATDKSKVMTELAADLGSAFNAGADEAALALRSGLLGESEPLRRFGVFLDEAKVKAKAVQMGIAKLGDVLTDNQKVTARYALIMEQTADSQGMFGRDTESLADTQKMLQAELENVSAEIGEALLPAMVELVKFAKDNLVPALTDFADAIDGTRDAAKDAENPLVMLSDILGDVFKKRTDEAKTSVGELNDFLTDLLSDLLDAATPWDTWTSAVDDAKAAQEKQTETAREGEKGIADLTGAVKETKKPLKGMETDTGKAAVAFHTMGTNAGETADDVEDAATKMKNAIKKWKNDLIDTARGIVTTAYQIISDKAELAAATHESAELRKVIATGKATTEQKARYKELGETQALLVLSLADNGVTAGKEVHAAIDDIRTRLKTAQGQERKALLATLATLKAIEAQAKRTATSIRIAASILAPGATQKQTTGPRHAEGGIRQAGIASWVGEKGPELSVPLTPSLIIPNDLSMQLAGAAAGGGGGDVHIHLEDKVAARGPRDIASVTKMLRRRGYFD